MFDRKMPNDGVKCLTLLSCKMFDMVPDNGVEYLTPPSKMFEQGATRPC